MREVIGTAAIDPAMEPVPGAGFELRGVAGDRIAVNQEHWLLTAPDANPAMLQMFRDRDRTPVRDLVPWAGEFAGKYLTSAVLGLRLTGDGRLREYLARFVRELIDAQADDGYLGVFPHAYRLTGKTIKPDGTEASAWDAWGHYHCMLGLLLWHEATGDPTALAACHRAADLLCRTFPDTDRRLVETGSEEMNLAPIHVLCLLYRRTGEPRYLQLARAIEADFEIPPAGDYVRTALQGRPFYATPKPRWESLHPIQGITELHFLTGEPRYRRAFEHIWWSITEHDRHNTGGFSSGEQATGNPYDPAPIETCGTVAWAALSVDMLRLTGDPVVADELELSFFNAVLGAQSPGGRWWTYDTPMDGVRRASAHDIVFQARAGSPELNCCSVNGPRGLGLLCEWAVMRRDRGLAVNYYGPGTYAVSLASGQRVRLVQETDYPLGGDVVLRVEPAHPVRFPLALRIPHWSVSTRVLVNGRPVDRAEPGAYLVLDRSWQSGDVVQLSFDIGLRVWAGEREAAGTASLYWGPLLLAYDQRFNGVDLHNLPPLDAGRLQATMLDRSGRPAPLLLLRLRVGGTDLVLCDFASAGAAGNPYSTWLPLRGGEPVPFSRRNPLRCSPV